MRTLGPLWNSMAIQGLGAVATLGVGLAIAAWQGPLAQGYYGLVRSTADLILALALFGFPQSLVHVLNHQRASPAVLLRWGGWYVMLLLVLALLLGGLAWAWERAFMPPWLGSSWAWVALLAGSIGWVLQGLQRVFVLCLGTEMQFAYLSSAPALTLLVAVLVLICLGRSDFELALLFSGIASAWIGSWQMRPLQRQPDWRHGGAPQLRALVGGGLHAYTQTVALALQPWASLQMLRLHEVSANEVGQFVFACYVYQALALPASFAAPLLFARVSRSVSQGRTFDASAWLRPILGLTTLVALAGAASMPYVVPALFGDAYLTASWACVWMALCGPLLLINRLGVSVLLGRGQFSAASMHAVSRAFLLPLTLTLCWLVRGSDAVSAAAFAWLIVETLCAVVVWMLWTRALVVVHGAKGC
jgi:O-antigen/teichoic acid export membrane protein